MTPLLIFAGICGPMTALLVWVIICELRGVPAFPDGPPPKPGQLDTLGRWIFGIACLALAALAFAVGGPVAVLVGASVIAALATLISVVWTVGQSATHVLRRRRADRTAAAKPPPLSPIHQRFALNFRRTIVELPLFFLAYG